MTEEPKVSIIINNYNYGSYLADAIESCLRQSYAGTETIVIDDGSTDDSRDIILQYEEKVKPLFKENGGQASCFNAGFLMSSGDIIIFLDADDYLAEDCVTQVVAVFKKEPGIVKVHWPLIQLNANGSPTGRILPDKKLIEGNLRQQVIEKGPAYAGGPPHSPPTSGNAWSKEHLKQLFPIPEEPFRYGADDYLFVLTPLLGAIKSIRKPLGYYRVHGKNDTLKPDYIHAFAERFENCAQVLNDFLHKKGVRVDPASWPRDHWYHLLRDDIRVIQNSIPEHETFILIDDDHWQTGDELMGRKRLHLTGRNGRYWGPPANDPDAIRELENSRTDRNANYLVFTWPAFWWLDHYQKFREHLDAHYPRILTTDRLIIYQLNDQDSKEINQQPIVSIIISSYNYGRYLRDAIDNALHQTYSPIEIIVVDDGSQDESPEIIRKYGDRLIPVFKNNGGQASSMNVGFEKSKGDIILFLDSDDVLYPGAVEKIISRFDNDHTVKVHWQMEEIDGSGKKNNKIVPKYQLAEGDYLNEVIAHGPVVGGGPPYSPPTSGNAWSRKFLQSIMPIPEELYRTNTDKYLHFLAPVYGSIKAIDEVLGAYRVHGENYSLHPVEQYADEFLSRFEKTIEIMDHHLQKLGIHAQTGTWSRDTWYHLILEGIDTIISIVPPHEKFILVDEDNWGIGSEVRDRNRLHLSEKCGEYGGLPGESNEAIRWLKACLEKGARYIFFTSTSSWWLDYYKELAGFLNEHAQLILADGRLTGYQFNEKNN